MMLGGGNEEVGARGPNREEAGQVAGAVVLYAFPVFDMGADMQLPAVGETSQAPGPTEAAYCVGQDEGRSRSGWVAELLPWKWMWERADPLHQTLSWTMLVQVPPYTSERLTDQILDQMFRPQN